MEMVARGLMTREEVERRFPEAVAFARQIRDVFGPDVRLIYARNQQGEELGRPTERGRT